jgi:hypothetical protein
VRSKKLLVIAASLSALLVVPLVFSLKLVNPAEFPLLSGVVTPSSSSPTVLVDPSNVIDEAFQAGSTFTVNVNVSELSDLFTWHVKVSWNTNVLNVSSVSYGEFLSQTISPDETSSSIEDVISVFNDAGYAWVAESVLGEYPGVSGNGCLASIEFLVVDYGCTDININVTENMPTKMLDSSGSNISFTTVNGYFSNKILGDIDGDGDVDRYDFGTFAGAYGTVEEDPDYDVECDFDRDGDVDRYDFGTFAGNYGRHI